MFYRETGVFKTSYAADMALMPLPSTRWAVAFLGALFLGIVPVFCDDYMLSVLNLILIAVVGAVGLNILVGYTDQVSIGHGAFMSVGAYTAAHLVTKLDAPFWIAIPAGGLMSAAIGTLVGIPSLRIKGLYLAIATLAAQLIIEWTINHVPWVSGGTQSTIQVGPPSVFGEKLTRAWQMYLFLMFFVILAMVGAQNLIRSRIGRAFIAIRDQDIAAEIIGIDIFRYKLWAFAISSFYAGATGVLYTYYLGIANYEQFQLDVSINFLAMVIIGGLGSALGPVLGAIFVTLLPIVTRRVLESAGGVFFSASDLSAVIPSLRLAIFGGLIIFFLVVEPEGLNRLWRNIRNYFRMWPFSY
jgi:branched-chain amino acid transport system permease protein